MKKNLKTVQLQALLRRLKSAQNVNSALAQECRDQGASKTAEQYAEGSAFAFFRAAEIAKEISKEHISSTEAMECLSALVERLDALSGAMPVNIQEGHEEEYPEMATARRLIRMAR